MAKKITMNGKEYNFDDLPDDMKKMLKDSNQNGIPDIADQGVNNTLSVNSNNPNPNVFVDTNIVSGGKNYKSFNDLPPELKAKIQQGLGKLKNIPFAKSMLKMYGLDVNTINNPQMNPGNSPFDKNNNQFGGSNSPFNQPSNPLFTGKKSNSGGIIAVLVFLLIGGFVALIIFATTSLGTMWEESFDLQGDPTHFDPIKAVGEMRLHIDPNAKLSSIDISYIRSDGTMDLTVQTYRPNVNYQFYKELAEPPKDAPPVGAGGTADGKWYEPVDADVYEPGQWRHVKRMGGGVSTEYSYVNKGIDLDRSTPITNPSEFVDDPTCSIADLWEAAIKKGAPASAVASVDYDSGGYVFSISDANIRMEFDFDCKLKED